MPLKLCILLISSLFYNILDCKLWKTVAIEIANEGSNINRSDFELAKQAFLRIKDEPDAQLAAQAIEKKWKDTYKIEASVGNKMIPGSLMNLMRYPLMTKEDAEKATLQLFHNKLIKQFLSEQKLEALKL